MRGGSFLAVGLAALVMTTSACGAGGGDDTASWQMVQHDLPGALLSVWGTSADDVWSVGADARDGTGPEVLHFDGTSWTRIDTGLTQGDLWWVVGTGPGDPIYMGGSGGVILRTDDGATFTPMTTPGNDTVFGIWGAAAGDLWAVGGAEGGAQGGFAWRLSGGDTWTDAAGFPGDIAATDAVWKMYGRSSDDAWMVGTNGLAVQWDGSNLTEVDTGAGESLFTVHANADRYAAVGGFGTGIILENDGSGWQDATPDPPPMALSGVCLGQGQDGFAVGQFGTVYQRDAGGWTEVDLGFTLDQNLHAVWIDPAGGVWAVGGQTLTRPLIKGVMIHLGDPVPEGL